MVKKLKFKNLIKLVNIDIHLEKEQVCQILKNTLEEYLVELKQNFNDDIALKQIEEPDKNVYGFFLYRLYNQLYYACFHNVEDTEKVEKTYIEYNESNIWIHPSVVVGKNFSVLSSNRVQILNNVQIGDNCTIGNNVKIGNKNFSPKILNNVIIQDGVSIYGNITIGNNVLLHTNCYVTDNVEDNQQVKLINQVQIMDSVERKNPSNKLIIYGVVPKFKNTIQILGEGFYNPKISFKNVSKELEFSITFWDKNKIIIKFKNTKPIENAGFVIMSIYSNRLKTTLIHSIGLEKALAALSN